VRIFHPASVLILIPLFCLTLGGCVFYSGAKPAKVILYHARKGDTIYAISDHFRVSARVIAEKNNLSTSEPLREGQVIRIPYQAPAKPSGPPLAKEQIKTEEPNEGSLKTVSISSARKYVGHLIWPVGGNGGHLSSRFGRRWFSFHEGLDIGGEQGLPIYAAHSGQVVYSGSGISGYGNLIILKGDGILTVYGHNRTLVAELGARVQQGERLALLGMSGKATGPHLHFETRVRDEKGKFAAVDPLVFFHPTSHNKP